MNKKQKQVNLGTTIFSSLITLAIGIFLGSNWNNLYLQFSPYINPAQKVTSNIKWDDLNEVYSQISSNFDGSIDKTKLIEGAKKGLTAALADPYTVYYDSKEAAEFKSDLKGEIKEAGVGIEMMKQGDYVVVTRTLPNNPARKAGVHAGDIIFAINGEEVWDKDTEIIASKLRGPSGEKVKLTVARDKQKLDFELTREKINNVSADITYQDKTAIISVYRFSEDTGTLVQSFTKDFKNKGINKVILDLRNNGGGYVTAARDLLSLWLDGDKILTQKSATIGQTITYAKRGEATLKDMKTIVLVNNATASASEIVAGALKDYKKATILGTKTYGKGVVQTMLELSGGSLLKITTAHWYTPEGQTINKTGISPDVEVERSYSDINSGKDPQLDKAKTL
ncbi:S41 family peptidase [TM7 phylum sp. oral taxon 351]|nr:S41 family peptidase [TM7 phylum sp. oral taxon 351]